MVKIVSYLIIGLPLLILSQSPSQVQQAKDYIKTSGMSNDQVKAIAKSKGISNDKIDLIMNEKDIISVPKASDTQELIKKNNLKDTDRNEESIDDINDDQNSIDQGEEKELTDQIDTIKSTSALEYFGYKIFKHDPELFQSTSVGIVNPDYVIGHGDEIIVMLWGETEFRQVLTVDREGFVFISDVGQVFVNGLNLNLLEAKLFRVLSQAYASLNPSSGNATTFLDISLGELRPLRVQVLGEVAQPGSYTVSPNTTLFSSLYFFNGPLTSGSLRDIRLIRNNKVITSIDFYDYLLTGNKPNDEKLQLDDIIFIPRRMKTVVMLGEINNPAIYELKPDEALSNLIDIAGGVKLTAYLNRAQIDRIVPFLERTKIGMDRMILDVNLNQVLYSEKDFKLLDGDKLNIFPISDLRLNTVEIEGAVARPGSYEIKESLRVKDLIIKADSLLGDAYLDRVDIIRLNPDYHEQLIKLNLEQVLKNNINHNIELQNLDKVKIHRKIDMIPRKLVSLVGHVKFPGEYYLRENMTLSDLIFNAGGYFDEKFKNRTFLGRAEILRFNEDNTQTIIPFDLGSVLDKDLFGESLLMSGDIIRIFPQSNVKNDLNVTISGLVKKPGDFIFFEEMTLKDLILQAGGFQIEVEKYEVEIVRIRRDFSNDDNKFHVINYSLNNDFSMKNSVNNESIFLSPSDHINVKINPLLYTHKKVMVIGEVMYPGEFSLLTKNESIKSIIERAGGFTDDAYLMASEFTRDGKTINFDLEKVFDKQSSKFFFPLANGDLINIKSHPNTYEILGQVNEAGTYQFLNGLRVRDVIKYAGGYTTNADKSNMYVKYPNGKSKKYYGLFKNPKVHDGSVIIVGEEPEKEPFDETEFVKELTGIVADLAQIMILIRLTNQ